MNKHDPKCHDCHGKGYYMETDRYDKRNYNEVECDCEDD